MDNSFHGGSVGSARILSRDTILTMSQNIFANYPGSRISVMGLNNENSRSDTFNPAHTNLQIDSPFVGPADYASVIANAFAVAPHFSSDCNGTFLRAAIDKLTGDASVEYMHGARVNARDDFTRIPVIIHLVDLHIGEAHRHHAASWGSSYNPRPHPSRTRGRADPGREPPLYLYHFPRRRHDAGNARRAALGAHTGHRAAD
jgi:hypothetical protein